MPVMGTVAPHAQQAHAERTHATQQAVGVFPPTQRDNASAYTSLTVFCCLSATTVRGAGVGGEGRGSAARVERWQALQNIMPACQSA